MASHAAAHPQPLVLLAINEPWLIRETASALAGRYRTVQAHTEHDAIEATQTQHPQAIVVDAGIAPPGYGLCTTLRTLAVATPVLLICAGHATRAQQLDALGAGAWDLQGTPLDTEQLLGRLDVYVQTRVELDRVSAECLVDRATGLYNPVGLSRRADELAALAARRGLALACAVFRPGGRPQLAAVTTDRLAVAFRSAGRLSDAVGRTGEAEFAVFAPGTTTWEAARLVRRISEQVEREFGYQHDARVSLRAGYSASPPMHKISPRRLLARARSALEATPKPGP